MNNKDEVLLSCIEKCLNSPNEPNVSVGIGLVQGKAGLFLCLDELLKVHPSNTLLEQRTVILKQLLSSGVKKLALGDGLTGLCMAVQYSSYKDILTNYLIEIHSVLLKRSHFLIERKEYDYYYGAAGILLYLLHFSSDDLSSLLQYFCKNICKDLKNNELHSSINCENKKIIGLNLGTAHGVTGCLLVLLAAWELGYKEIVSSTIHKLSEVLLNNRLSGKELFHFPSFIGENNQKYKSDIAWCYGDLMVWYSLWKMAHLERNDILLNTAIKQLIGITKRPDMRKDSIVLCHGLSSLFIVYRRLYKETKIAEFDEFSIKMHYATIKLLSEYCLQSKNNSVYRRIIENPSFFVGISGCVLSLLVDETDDLWTKILLL